MRNLLNLFLFIPFFLISCGGEPEEEDYTYETYEEDEVDTTPIDANWDDIAELTYKEDQNLIIEGYISPLPSTVYMSGGTISVHVRPRRNQQAGTSVSLDLTIGTGNNMVHELPEKYSPEDYKIVADNGDILTAGNKVKIEAMIYFISSETYTMKNVVITPLDDPFDSTVFENAVPLTTDIIEDENKNKVYCYMDGKLTLPGSIFSLDGDINLDFENNTNDQISTIKTKVNNGPSAMDPVPDNYGEEDLVIRDYQGNNINFGSIVRVYGTWERSEYVSGDLPGRFFIEEIEVR